jgi:hypothetical protein
MVIRATQEREDKKMTNRSSSVLIIGDPHFKTDNTLQTDFFSESVIKLITSRKEDIIGVVILGDVLHRHDKVDLFPLIRAMNFLSAIRKTLREEAMMWVIIGNHDRPNNKTFLTPDHPFSALKLWGTNTIVVDTVIHDTTFGFLFVPYVEPGRFFEATSSVVGVTVENISCKNINTVFCHQEFRGCKFGGIESTAAEAYPRQAPLCVSGHIHDSQWVGKNLFYPGTPYEQNWVTLQEGNNLCRTTRRGVYTLTARGADTPPSLTKIIFRDAPTNIVLRFPSVDKFLKESEETVASLRRKNPIAKTRIEVTAKSAEEALSQRGDVLQLFGGDPSVQVNIVVTPSTTTPSTMASSARSSSSSPEVFKSCVLRHLQARGKEYSAGLEELIQSKIFSTEV